MNEFFQLNVITDDNTQLKAREWALKTRPRLAQIGDIGSLEYLPQKHDDMRYYPVAQWKADLTNLKRVALDLKNLIGQIEMRGILKGYDYFDRK